MVLASLVFCWSIGAVAPGRASLFGLFFIFTLQAWRNNFYWVVPSSGRPSRQDCGYERGWRRLCRRAALRDDA